MKSEPEPAASSADAKASPRPLRLALAPLAGFTDAPFRRLCSEGGADFTFTEMVSAAGLAHGSSPTRHLMEAMPGEGPLVCQLFGAKEEELAFAARFASSFSSAGASRFAALDLNAGCPMTKVTCSGAGAKLAEDPEKIYRLLKAMTSETDLPITLKTRLGPHPQRTTVFEILDAAERAGAAAMTVHARYTSQMHGGPIHLDALAEVVRRAKIPVYGNGSVTDAGTAAAMAATGVAGILIGRAALAQPDVFRRMRAAMGLAGRTGDGRQETRIADSTRPTFVISHLRYLLAFREQLAARYPGDHVPGPDAYASVKMHVHLFRYFNGRPGAAALRARLNTVRTLAEIREIIGTMAGAEDGRQETGDGR